MIDHLPVFDPASVAMMNPTEFKAELLNMARAIVAESTHPDAVGFDVATWLDRWLERPLPALAGRRPADMLDTDEGQLAVKRLMGAISSGVYL